MSKFNSENKFIKNLRFHLSFYFNDIDISNININESNIT